MREVLVVDDDFMVAEIHRKFVDHVDGFVPSAPLAPAPKRSSRRRRCTPTSSCSTSTCPT